MTVNIRYLSLRYKVRHHLDLHRYQTRLRERFFGVDLGIFDDTIAYYHEEKRIPVSRQEALARALNKKRHKDTWGTKQRATIQDIFAFYQEADVYPFRQPYNYRFGGYGWMMSLVRHIKHPHILEYGCGSACLTEWLVQRYPYATYSVADIPSTTLEFVRWKQRRHQYPYKILEIGPGKQGIPLGEECYSLIVCKDVLEHTPNPLEIVEAFIDHLEPTGILLLDFLNAPGGENLQEAVDQRPATLQLLRERLTPIKEIDVGGTVEGIYIKQHG